MDSIVNSANVFDDSGNNGKHGLVVHGEEDTQNGQETTAKKLEEEQVKCSEKWANEVQVTDDNGNGEIYDDPKVGNKTNGKQHETEEKKEKKSKRRGGKGRKNKEILNCYSGEKIEKKGLQYSRKEMVALRHEGLEEQKKKWVEVYCGLDQLVAQEYDELVKSYKNQQKDSAPSFDFDPRAQFQKNANLGEGCLHVADNHLENLSTTDPASSLPISDEREFSAVEGECSQDDDSDEDYSSIQRPAFLVTGEPDFDSGPPQDGLEYLRRVRWEAARIPKVTVAKVNNTIKEQSPYMPQIPDIVKCRENLLPLKQWEDSFLADFSELRRAFMQLDLEGSSPKISTQLQPLHKEDTLSEMLESNNFEKIFSLNSIDEAPCISETSDAKVDPCSPGNSSVTADTPALSTILKMDSAARTSMLKRRISSMENITTLPRNDGLWLFALCAVVDSPLDADTSAALRSLLRICARLRAAKTEVDNEVIILNILATISGRYFGQLEK